MLVPPRGGPRGDPLWYEMASSSYQVIPCISVIKWLSFKRYVRIYTLYKSLST
jgi:hypothetical protein